jgi:hypothetical protein
MANALYGLGREAFLNGGINWTSDNIKCVLVDNADYTVSIDTHDFLSDVTLAGRVATSGNLATKTSTLGVAGAADITLTAVSGDVSESLVIYQDSGSSTTSKLIAYIDTAAGLPVTPNGGNIAIAWDTGANKIFKL